MPLPIKNRYTIHEAARYIASATGEKVTISQIIDWGTQGFYGLYLLTNDCHVKYEGAADVVEISGAMVKFHPNATQAATLENGYPIEIDSGLHEGRKVIFMKSPKQLYHNKFGEKENPAVFNSTSMVLLGTELTAFTASIAKPQQADNQTSKPANAPAAMVATLPDTSPNGDDVEEQAPAADDHDETLAALFDPKPVEALEKMFPADGKWTAWAEKAAANGLIDARISRGMFNPYKAGVWFVNKGAKGWDDARLYRALKKNLPARSRDEAHLFGDDLD